MNNSKINMHKRMAMGQKPTGMRRGGMGGRTGDMMYSRGYGVGEKSKRMPTMLKDRGPTNMKKGGKVHKAAVGSLMTLAKNKKMLDMLGMKKGGDAKKMGKRKNKALMKPAARVTGTRPNRPINPTNPGFPYRPRPMQKMMGGGVSEAARKVRASGMKKGGLKPVDKKKNPGLAKLPTRVRNKMGYMKKGGMRRNTQRMNRLEELGRVDAERAKTMKGKQRLMLEKRRLVRELKKRGKK